MPTGVEPEELTNNSKGIWHMGFHWAPDSRSFLALKRFMTRKANEVWRVPIDGDVPTKLDMKLDPPAGGFQSTS